jgi:hypothetical protein
LGEYTGVETTPDGVITLNHDSVPVCFQELIVKDDGPLSIIDFSTAMPHDIVGGSLPAIMLCYEGLEGAREL